MLTSFSIEIVHMHACSPDSYEDNLFTNSCFMQLGRIKLVRRLSFRLWGLHVCENKTKASNIERY